MRRGGFALLLVLIMAGMLLDIYVLGKGGRPYEEEGVYTHLEAGDSFRYAENHPAFAEFSSFIQPWKDPVNRLLTPFESLAFVSRLNHLSADSVVDGLNFLIDAASEGTIYHDFYTEEEREEDPSREETGLLVIPGERGKPLAVLASGGAFQSVCLFLEGIPVGRVLHEMGYSVCILKYRVDPSIRDYGEAERVQAPLANEDYRRAMQYLFAQERDLGISMEDYSVWGFSAGGQLTSMYGMDNEWGYFAEGLPCPAAMVLVYSGWPFEGREGDYATMPPAYFAYLPEDEVIGKEHVEGIRELIGILSELEIPTGEKTFEGARHGFGEGRGTGAEGWIPDAVSFWEEYAGR